MYLGKNVIIYQHVIDHIFICILLRSFIYIYIQKINCIIVLALKVYHIILNVKCIG